MAIGLRAIESGPAVPRGALALVHPAPGIRESLLDLALATVEPIRFDGATFFGPGWDLICAEGSVSECILFGEAHGAAEAPVLADALFCALEPHGYDVLAETLEISRPPFPLACAANERRLKRLRAGFTRRFRRAARKESRVVLKTDAIHVMRGAGSAGDFNVASLAHEVAAQRGGRAFSMLVGERDAPVDMFEQVGLGWLVDEVKGQGIHMIDLRPLRTALGSAKSLLAFNNPEAVKAIFAFDVLVIWNAPSPQLL